ncbi:hypothetical protein K3495_g13375 [Podosphaera aphanis]|nr:hypothetical protein K3495_g13375 [Podosphaera aphanis]
MASENDMKHESKQSPSRISINRDDIEGHDKPSTPRSSSGWDGKLRLEKKTEVLNSDCLSDSGFSDVEHTPKREVIQADEDTTEIDCVHSRISSISALRLERFKKVTRLCLRQNSITEIEGLSCLASTLTDLDLYDNLITQIQNLEELQLLSSLDLSFNKIRHIKHISQLTSLTDLYFVQNKIGTINNLSGLSKLRNLELAANRIRKIQGLETLTGLEELWLGKNKITEISGLDTLHNLKILSIQSNRITNISGLTRLIGLEELYISHNALKDLSGLEGCTSLRILEISNNSVSSLEGIAHLSRLKELWASYNQLDSFAEVERILGNKNDLNTVYFEGNPLQMKGPAVYRNKVKIALPQVFQIDASFVRVS